MDDKLDGLTITQLIERQANRQLTALEIVEACQRRITALDGDLAAMICLNPEATSAAAEADRDRENGGVLGPLHGVPVVIKDNIETQEPMPTTAGSLALTSNVTGRDAPLVARLRDAGAIVLGKTNLSEWANFRSPRSSSGWSAVGGQTRNPVDPTRSPCGSSSGSAVAVAAGMAPVAIGTETDGSIICPASVNGVVGIKPAVGDVAQDRIVPISHSQDTAGPFARTVTDAAIVWSVISGRVLPTLPGPGDFKVGVVRSLMGYHPGVDARFESALAALRAGGVELIDGLAFLRPKGFRRACVEVLLHEFKAGINGYLSSLENVEVENLDSVIAFNIEHADEELVHFGQELFEAAAAKGGLDSAQYLESLELVQRATRDEGIDALLSEHGVDVLVAPSGGPAWPIDWINGDHFLGSAANYPAVAGYPHISVPMGAVGGLPVGLSFFGNRDGMAPVLSAAHTFEGIYRAVNPGSSRMPG